MIKQTLIALCLTFSLSAWAQNIFESGGSANADMSPDQKLRFAERMIQTYYVDAVNGDSIVEEAIRAMLKTLDPHSAYSTAEETKELNEPLEGKFSGIGIQYNMSTDTVYVIQTISGGPSEKVGLLPGDRIITVDDSIIAGKKLQTKQVVKLLRGPKGSKVRLGVKRGDNPDLIEFLVVRDDIPINSVSDAYMVTPEIGYIALTRFAEDSGKEVEKAITKLKKLGMKQLILDLQGNGGGYLGSAVDIASLFLNQGDLIVYTHGRNPSSNKKYHVASAKPAFTGPLVVLVDQYTASSSEIVSGALQDNERAQIIGRRTFGKGLVQRAIPFADGSMMRLTVSKYYTPSGRCIQKPYDKGHGEEYQLDILNRLQSGELFSADSIHLDKSQEYYTAGGRVVYGGGGIMPDIFVPLDTAMNSKYYRDMVAKGIISQYCIRYVDTHRKALLKKYKTEIDFYKSFVTTPEIIDDLVKYAEAEGLEPNDEQLAISRPVIEAVIRGLLARDLYPNASYARFTNQLNPTFTMAVELLQAPAKTK